MSKSSKYNYYSKSSGKQFRYSAVIATSKLDQAKLAEQREINKIVVETNDFITNLLKVNGYDSNFIHNFIDSNQSILRISKDKLVYILSILKRVNLDIDCLLNNTSFLFSNVDVYRLDRAISELKNSNVSNIDMDTIISTYKTIEDKEITNLTKYKVFMLYTSYTKKLENQLNELNSQKLTL